MASSFRSTTPTPRSTTPSRDRDRDSQHRSRSNSQHSSERRPFGPRAPSPMPPKSPLLLPSEMKNVDADADVMLEQTQTQIPSVNVTPQPRPSTPKLESVLSPFRRSNHQPTMPMPMGIIDSIPKPSTSGAAQQPSIEPLSIKKKTSVRSAGAHGSPIPARKMTRNSPLTRSSAKIGLSPRRVSPQVRHVRTAGTTAHHHHFGKTIDVDRIVHLAQTTKEDVCISRLFL